MKILYFTLIAIIVFGFSAISTSNPVFGQITMGGPIRTVHFQFSQMASSGKNVYVVYQQNVNNGGSYHVYFTKSSDGGRNFGNTIELDNGSGVQPVLASYGNNVYVAWENGYTGYPPSYVLLAKSIDDGNTFDKPIILDNKLNSSSVITQLVADKNHLFAVIDELGETPPYISDTYFLASHDNGSTWGQKIELLPYPVFENSLGYNISIQQVEKNILVSGENKISCTDNPNVCNYVIFFRKSTDLGSSFGKEINVTTVINPVQLQMAVSGNNVYLVWATLVDNSQVLFFAKSNDGGSTFSTPVILSQKSGDSEWPHIVAGGNNVYFIWKYDNAGVLSTSRDIFGRLSAHQSGIFFVKSTDGGNTLSQPVNLSGDIGASYFSGISISHNNLYASWTSIREDKENVFFSKSTDNGTTFDNPINLTGRSDAFFGQIVSSDDNVYVAGGTSYPGDILWFKASNDGGSSFGLLTTLDRGFSNPGSISRISPEVHIVNNQNTSNNDMFVLAEVEIPIAAGIAVGVFMFTRKGK